MEIKLAAPWIRFFTPLTLAVAAGAECNGVPVRQPALVSCWWILSHISSVSDLFPFFGSSRLLASKNHLDSTCSDSGGALSNESLFLFRSPCLLFSFAQSFLTTAGKLSKNYKSEQLPTTTQG